MSASERDDFTRLLAGRRNVSLARYENLGPRARLRRVLADLYTPDEVSGFLSELESRAARGYPLVRRELRTPATPKPPATWARRVSKRRR